MKFKALINIMPHDELLDPQGKVVSNNLSKLQLKGIDNVRIGKHIVMEVEGANENEAAEKVRQACSKLLANPVIEKYDFELENI